MKVSKTSIGLAIIAAAAIGFFANELMPKKEPDRPFLSFIAKAARTALWIMMFAEDKPCERTNIVAAPQDEPFIDHARSL